MPGIDNKEANTGGIVEIKRPDQTVFEMTILEIGLNEFLDILVGKTLTKRDFPINSGVFLKRKDPISHKTIHRKLDKKAE